MRPSSAVEGWACKVHSGRSAQARTSSAHMDLRPITQGLEIIPRAKSASRTITRDFSRRNSLKSDSASSVQSVADENLSLVDIEDLLSERVKDKKDDLKAAFEAFDQEGNKIVTKGEFRRVIEGFLVPLTESQFEGLLAKLEIRANRTIPYMEFLGKYCKVSSAMNRIPYMSTCYRNLSLGDLQCHLKEKIGGNLKNITRAFRLFDYNCDGQIQQHELRKVLEGYCFPMSQQEFHRLWSYYSPNNADTISYKEFLEKLGVDCENYTKIAPDSIKLALNWDAVSLATRPKSKTSLRPFSGKPKDTLDEIQTKFLSKMKKNHNLVEKALQAFDLTDSGLVSLEDLRSIFSNFFFPMDDSTFSGLLNRFGVSTTEPLKWRRFLGLFKDDKQTIATQKDSTAETVNVHSVEAILPRLHQQILDKELCLMETFLNVDKNRTGFISRDELRWALENISINVTDDQFQVLADHMDAEHVDVINYQQFLDFLHQQRPNMHTTKPNEKSSAPINTSTPTQNTVEEILKEKLAENCNMLIESIAIVTQNQSDIIPPEELRRLIQEYGVPLSEHHFRRLCEPCLEAGGVNYKLFLKNLGIPECRADSINMSLCKVESENQAHKAQIFNMKTQAVQDVVLRKLKDRLQRRGLTLQDCLMSTRKNSAAVLSLRDFCKILDDCGIFLEGPQFQMLIESLGFNCGQISVADFVTSYEETTSDKNEEPDRQIEVEEVTNILSAEDCFSQLNKKIKEYHGDVLTAFRLMDNNRDGVVNRNDFRALFDSLMFVTKQSEYQRLLDLLGLTPGATLNYAEFCDKVQSGGKMRLHQHNILRDGWLGNACDQVHDHLAAIAHKGSVEFLKLFSHPGEDGERLTTRNDLKQLLFKYCLPITPDEFDKLWSRYDEEGKGFLTQEEFLRKLKVKPEEDCQSDTHEQSTNKVVSMTTPDPEVNLQNLRKWIRSDLEKVSDSLVVLDKNRDGHVTIRDLLSLLQRHGFQLKETELKDLLNLLGFDVHHKTLPYLDFLKRVTGFPFSNETEDQFFPERVENVEELSPEKTIQRVKEVVTASSDILYKAFAAFDKTRDGMLPQVEFRQVLNHFCVRLSDMQFRKLLCKLGLSEGEEILVDWREFLEVFNLHKQETADEWLKKIQKMRFPNQTRPLLINDVLRRIQEVVSARLQTITGEMMDLDYANINTISKKDFKSICDHHFMRLTDDQFQNLWKVLPVNNFGNLEYREFLKKFSGEQKHIEKAGRSLPGSARPSLDRSASLRRPKTAPSAFRYSSSPGPVKLSRPSTSNRRQTPMLNCEDVEMKLRPRIQECWRHIQRRCREADTERTGEIDAGTFLEILQSLRIELSPTEFEQLAVKYDIKNTGRLSYPDFLRHFVLMFGHQVNPSTYRLKLQLPRTPMSPGPLSGQCAEAMLRISKPVQLFWRQMRQKFIAFDRDRTGKISLQDFRKVLRQFSVNLSEEEFFHLTSFFDKNITGKISYNDFLRIFLK
ncbi:EF-hand calcium-binding domain-containing protein 6 [Triplophysa dalaica]|uniref:EF-hand calcium-binding domain-containing protein 6 n=1 Tax=Triplophysa dalaica TaxID=1582913 RepID=UPI0024DFD380|nr:EF-hand calcium-binding domain-containing protein 6 [Triplophysa dalaica]